MQLPPLPLSSHAKPVDVFQAAAALEKELTQIIKGEVRFDRGRIGGMIGNNSCGTHSLFGGKTVDNVEELRILLYDGTQMTVRATSETELAEVIAQGGRRGEIYSRLRAIQEHYAELIRARFTQ